MQINMFLFCLNHCPRQHRKLYFLIHYVSTVSSLFQVIICLLFSTSSTHICHAILKGKTNLLKIETEMTDVKDELSVIQSGDKALVSNFYDELLHNCYE